MKTLCGESLFNILLEKYNLILESHRVAQRGDYEHEWELEQFLNC